jgi:hypothetical protein
LAATSPPPQSQDGGLGPALADVSERTTLIVREEIELAKAEVLEKVTQIAKAAAVGAFAGIFVVTGLLFALHALAYGLWSLIYNGSEVWVGYIITAGVLFLLAALAGLLAFRWIKKGTPPAPTMAIDEAKLVRETLRSPAPEKTL